MDNPWLRRLRLEPGDENLAQQLRPIRAKDPEKLWFHGKEPYFDVFFDLQGEEITWFQFTLRGCALTWTPTSLAAGFTNEMAPSRSETPASHFIEPVHQARALADIVAELLESATHPLFAKIVDRLKN